jgi:hypothetical protein
MMSFVCAVLVGCASLPTFEEAETRTHDPMQQIIERLPDDVEVEVLSKGEPGPCGGDGASYTAQWFASVNEGFDGRAFIESLPERLPDDFVVADAGVEPTEPAIALDYRETTLSVSFYDNDDYHGIYILGISGCAQLPPSTSHRPSAGP